MKKKTLTSRNTAANYLITYILGVMTALVIISAPALAAEFVSTVETDHPPVEQPVTVEVIQTPSIYNTKLLPGNLMLNVLPITEISAKIVNPVATVDSIAKQPVPVATEPIPVPFDITSHFGEQQFTNPNGVSFNQLTLPSEYYPGIDFSYFKAWMPYTVLGKNNQCGKIAYSTNAFTDENGLRRYNVDANEFSVNGQPDYLVAMGTFYKPKGTVGQRYLIVTPSGSYTVRTSDELADAHSDKHHMFSWHGNYACVLEFLVDKSELNRSAKQMGTVSAIGGLLSEDITHLYLID